MTMRRKALSWVWRHLIVAGWEWLEDWDAFPFIGFCFAVWLLLAILHGVGWGTPTG